MLGFLKRVTQKRLDFEKLQILQMIVQQVVLSLEGAVKLPGANKKALALELVGQILAEMKIVAPHSLVDAMRPFGNANAFESSVHILKSLDLSAVRPEKPKFSLDISGRSKSGN